MRGADRGPLQLPGAAWCAVWGLRAGTPTHLCCMSGDRPPDSGLQGCPLVRQCWLLWVLLRDTCQLAVEPCVLVPPLRPL